MYHCQYLNTGLNSSSTTKRMHWSSTDNTLQAGLQYTTNDTTQQVGPVPLQYWAKLNHYWHYNLGLHCNYTDTILEGCNKPKLILHHRQHCTTTDTTLQSCTIPLLTLQYRVSHYHYWNYTNGLRLHYRAALYHYWPITAGLHCTTNDISLHGCPIPLLILHCSN